MSLSRALALLLALAPIAGCGRGAPPAERILVVTIDTLRWDRLGYMGYDVETPNLDALATSGTYFTDVVSVAPLTLPAHSSLFTGLYPPSHGVRTNGVFRLDDDIETMAEVFRGAGYRTGAFVGSFVLESRFGLDQGFELYDDELPDENPVHKIYFRERPAGEVARRAVEWIQNLGDDEPFFCWVHVFDPHAPYAPPSPFGENYAGRPYAGEIAYTDQALGPLVNLVGSMDASLVVVTADHGESLGEHGESTHGLFVYDVTTRIPLVMNGDGVPRGKRVDARVRSVDIAPTVMELAGLGLSGSIDGETLLPFFGDAPPPSRDAYAESFLPRYSFNWSELRTLTSGSTKYIQAPRPELFDLDADPDEGANLWSDAPSEEGKRLARELARLADEEVAIAEPVEVDPQTAERLESLGYLMSDPAAAEDDRERPDPKDRVEIYERMQALLSPELNVDELIDGYRDILDEQPTNNLARNRLANTLSEAGLLDEAVEEYRILVRDSEIDFKGWENLSAALLLLQRTEEALDTTELAVAAAPWNPEFSVLRGEALEQAKRLEEARDAYTAALELDGTAENFWRRGVVQERLGEPTAAEADFRRAMGQDAEFEPAVAAMARLLSKAGRVDEAYELIGAEAGTVELRTALAEAHIASGRFNEARALLEQAQREAPENTRVLAILGPLYARDGNLTQATATLERARELGEAAPEVRRNLGLIYLQQGRTADAVAELEAACRDAPQEPNLWYSLGNAYARSQNLSRAVTAYERALELRSPWPEARFNLAIAAEGTGQRQKAADAYRAFLQSSDPSDTRRRSEAESRLRRLSGSE